LLNLSSLKRCPGFDKFHKKPIRTSFVSYKRLILLLTRSLSKKLDVQKLSKLYELKSRKEAEILILRLAYKEYKKF
jgi:hypothetical protein